MVVAEKYVIVEHFVGIPKLTDMALIEEELPPIKDGEFLVQAEYISVDPYQRVYSSQLPLNSTMIGSQVAKIIESKNSEYPIGQRIIGYLGWRTHTVINLNNLDGISLLGSLPQLIPDIGDLPRSLLLGVLGMPGTTAYFGFLEICKPKSGETLVVSAAAGAVGSHVGQIGKILGMHVIGIVGSDEKCKWITEELGFDHAINYKTGNVAIELNRCAPDGIDCYFDNVGGEISCTVIHQMRMFGRIAVCGSISSYNTNLDEIPKCSILQPSFIFKQLKMEGFIVTRWGDRVNEALEKNLTWIRQGKLLYHETVTEGFHNIFKALIGQLRGENRGKAIVDVQNMVM